MRLDPQPSLLATQRYYRALILLAGIVLIASTWLSVHTAGSLRASVLGVSHSHEVAQRLAMLGRELGDAEAAQRANLLIEDQRSRQYLQRASTAAREHLGELRRLVADNPEQSERAVLLNSLVDAQLSALASIADAKPGDVLEALRLPVEQGGATMGDGQLRALIAEMAEVESGLLARRSAEMEALIAQTNGTVIIANALAIVAAAIGLFLINRSRRAWQRALDAESDKRQAQRASAEKSQFLASMSHEIRTPMNAIFGFTQLLAQRLRDPQDRQYLRAIQTSGDTLLSLINDILDLSKIEAGRLDLQKRPSDLRELVDSSLAAFAQLAAEKQLRLAAEVDPAVPAALHTDPDRLRQVLFNLIGNALKFTEQGGVTIRVQASNSVEDDVVDLRIDVEDTGVGIAAEQQGRIFEPFHQAPAGDGKSRPGSGLGLSICRQLVGLLGGRIEVSSRIGEGSCFSCRFERMAVSQDQPRRTSERWDASVDFDRLRPLKLLVVDDVAWNRELLQAIFAQTHHQVRTAEDGLQALQAVAEERPDVVLMDLRMPRLDGRQASQRLRQRWGESAPLVVALTASSLHGEEGDWQQYFDAYLRKPLARADLYRTLAGLVGVEGASATAEKHQGSAAQEPAAEAAAAVAAMPEPEQSGVDAQAVAAARERLQSLLEERLPQLQQSLRMREVGRFADALQQIGGEARLLVIADYGERLARAVEQFDVTTAESLLQQFPTHVAAVLTAAREESV